MGTKRWSVSLIIRTTLTKNIMRYLTAVRMAIIKKSRDRKHWRECEEKCSLYTVGSNVNWFSHYKKIVWSFLKTLINRTYKAILHLHIYLEEIKLVSKKDICHPLFTAALLTIAKTCKQRKVSIDRWMDERKMYIIQP